MHTDTLEVVWNEEEITVTHPELYETEVLMTNEQLMRLWGQMILVHQYELFDKNRTWREEEEYFFARMTLRCSGITSEESYQEALQVIIKRLPKRKRGGSSGVLWTKNCSNR